MRRWKTKPFIETNESLAGEKLTPTPHDNNNKITSINKSLQSDKNRQSQTLQTMNAMQPKQKIQH